MDKEDDEAFLKKSICESTAAWSTSRLLVIAATDLVPVVAVGFPFVLFCLLFAL